MGEIAAELYPERWQAALKVPGKRGQSRRRSLRRQAENEIVLRGLRADGASCLTCKHRGSYPLKPTQPTCDLESDFHGYALTRLDDLCVRFAAKTQQVQP